MFGISAPDLPHDAPELNASPESSELVCVCCNCDRVRNRSGEWRDDHTPAAGERHTHGICPVCFVLLYPDYAQLKGK
jgi:hypothetical protein